MHDYSKLIKAYDVRGKVPDQLDGARAREIGAAFARLVGGRSIVLAQDMRSSSELLATAFADGVMSQGLDVIDLGLGSTDLLYFASGRLGLPGAVITASHNPAQYNGIKMCRLGASPIGADTGLDQIRSMLESGVAAAIPTRGRPSRRSMLREFATHLRSMVDLSSVRPMKVVVDAGNGMAGLTVPAVLGDKLLPALPLTIIPLYFDLDGTFPNHDAHPQDPENRRDLQEAVKANDADLGLAFDGDADRCFFIDETGEHLSPTTIMSLIANEELARHPGSTIVYNAITSSAVPEVVASRGGIPIRERVGNNFMKATMARRNAVFGGEHSGHYYFRDFWWADSGLLAAMHVLAAIGGRGASASAVASNFQSPYWTSGEVSRHVADPHAAVIRVAEMHKSQGTIDWLDGLTVATPSGWFNLRAANTADVIRLNVEAPNEADMIRIRDRVLADIDVVDGPDAPRRL